MLLVVLSARVLERVLLDPLCVCVCGLWSVVVPPVRIQNCFSSCYNPVILHLLYSKLCTIGIALIHLHCHRSQYARRLLV